jgi:hypothetical protein
LPDSPALPADIKSVADGNRLRRKTRFLNRLKQITLFSHRRQNISISFYQNLCLLDAVPSRSEGRFAVVTDVEAGCGGRIDVAAWFYPRRRTTLMRTVKSRGPGIPTLMSSRSLMRNAQR